MLYLDWIGEPEGWQHPNSFGVFYLWLEFCRKRLRVAKRTIAEHSVDVCRIEISKILAVRKNVHRAPQLHAAPIPRSQPRVATYNKECKQKKRLWKLKSRVGAAELSSWIVQSSQNSRQNSTLHPQNTELTELKDSHLRSTSNAIRQTSVKVHPVAEQSTIRCVRLWCEKRQLWENGTSSHQVVEEPWFHAIGSM